MGYRARSVYVFCAPTALNYRLELEVHLLGLPRERDITVRCEDRPSKGTPPARPIPPAELIEDAAIVVLLLDAGIRASYARELERAEERRLRDHLQLIYVRASPVWGELSLASLPRASGMTLRHLGPVERDEVYVDVVEVICKLLDREKPEEDGIVQRTPPDAPRTPQDRDVVFFRPKAPEQREACMLNGSNTVSETDELRFDGDRYRILEQISWGWVSRWRAWDTVLRRPVIIGVLCEGVDPEARKALVRRLKAWSALPRDLFARIIREPREEGECSYIVEDLDGDLQQLVLKDAVEQEAILPLLCHITSLVADLHDDHHLVHGDLEPRSVLIGGQGKLKLGVLDPLLGAGLDAEPESSDGRAISVYKAPERSEIDVARESIPCSQDVFSLGMMAIFVLGRKIPRARSAAEIDFLISDLNCHPLVKDVLRTAVSPHSSERHPNARELLNALVAAYRGSRASDFVEWRDVHGGTFEMGTNDEDARPHWRPSRTVEVSAFKMARYPVTQGLYARVMLHNPSQWPQNRNAPVNCVSFHDAIEFCNRLSMLDNCTPVYRFETNKIVCDWSADGYRLPTEAEWEFAARGPSSKRFPWGDDFRPRDVCWNGEGCDCGPSNRRGPWSVGQKELESPFGVQELIGNVWEWCWDYFAFAEDLRGGLDPIGPDQPQPIPKGLESRGTAFRMLRGGSWTDHDSLWLRGYARVPDDESARDPNIGFRVVRGVKPHVTVAAAVQTGG